MKYLHLFWLLGILSCNLGVLDDCTFFFSFFLSFLLYIFLILATIAAAHNNCLNHHEYHTINFSVEHITANRQTGESSRSASRVGNRSLWSRCLSSNERCELFLRSAWMALHSRSTSWTRIPARPVRCQRRRCTCRVHGRMRAMSNGEARMWRGDLRPNQKKRAACGSQQRIKVSPTWSLAPPPPASRPASSSTMPATPLPGGESPLPKLIDGGCAPG